MSFINNSEDFISYYNKEWDIKFDYPKNYIKLDDIDYPFYATSFVNDLKCKDIKNSYKCEILIVGQKHGKLPTLNYPFSYDGTILYTEDLPLTVLIDKNELGKITVIELGDSVISFITIPRYHNGAEFGEIFFYIEFPKTKLEELKELNYQIINSLELDTKYIPIKETPIDLDFSIWFQNDSKISCDGHMYCCLPKDEEINWYVFKDDSVKKINISMDDFETGGGVLSSNGQYTAFLYWHKENVHPGGYGNLIQKGIAYVDNFNPKELFILKTNGDYRHTKLEWSPNDKYLSYLGINGNGGVIDMQTGEEIKKLNSDVLVTWLDEDTFSFIDDDKLYLYSISQQNEIFITDYVLQAVDGYESDPIYQKPHWSLDRKFVVYYEGGRNYESTGGYIARIAKTREEAVFFDIENKIKYYFGDLLEEGESIFLQKTDINTSFIGWDEKDRFLYFSNTSPDIFFDGSESYHKTTKEKMLKSIKLVNGTKVIEEHDIFSIKGVNREDRLLWSMNNNTFLNFTNGIIYDIESQKESCVLKHLNYDESITNKPTKEPNMVHGDYLLMATSLDTKFPKTSYLNRFFTITKIEIYNTKTCEYLGSIVITDVIHNISIID